jgi:hypothetical protein
MPGGTMTWSLVQIDAYPAASARAAVFAIISGLEIGP